MKLSVSNLPPWVMCRRVTQPFLNLHASRHQKHIQFVFFPIKKFVQIEFDWASTSFRTKTFSSVPEWDHYWDFQLFEAEWCICTTADIAYLYIVLRISFYARASTCTYSSERPSCSNELLNKFEEENKSFHLMLTLCPLAINIAHHYNM